MSNSNTNLELQSSNALHAIMESVQNRPPIVGTGYSGAKVWDSGLQTARMTGHSITRELYRKPTIMMQLITRKRCYWKQEEAGIHEVTPDSDYKIWTKLDDEPMHKVQNIMTTIMLFAMENEHPGQPESSNDIYLAEHGDTNITIDSSDICYDRAPDDQDKLIIFLIKDRDLLLL
ncbi:hypothetical protein Tco_0784563 [Tanacetum coccineum]